MKKTSNLTAHFWLLIGIIALGGCGYTNSITEVQNIVELNWKQDGTAIYGFIQKTSFNDAQTSPLTEAFDFCSFKSDGSLNKAYPADQQAINDFSFATFIDQNASQVITQLGADLYRIDLNSGAYTKLTELFHLLAVSPDLHYAVGSHSPANRPRKTITILDITQSPVQVVGEFDDSTGLTATSGLWLSGQTFALTEKDSTGNNISIYDFTGNLVKRIGGASAPFHISKYIPSTNTIYFVNRSGNILTDGTISKVNLSTNERQSVLVDSAENFDISPDEQFITFTSYRANTDGTITLKLYIRNIATGAQIELASDPLRYTVFSPAADRIAYIRKRDQYFNEVRVITATRP